MEKNTQFKITNKTRSQLDSLVNFLRQRNMFDEEELNTIEEVIGYSDSNDDKLFAE